MTAIALVYWHNDPMDTGSPGFSPAANEVGKWLAKARRHARDNASDWRTLARTLVLGLRQDEDTGADSIPDPLAEGMAIRFIDALPIELPAPDVAVDPDGEVSLDWWFAPQAQFSISVGGDGKLTYAGLIGPEVRRHGVELFGETIPKILLDTLGELATRFGTPPQDRSR